MDFQLQSDRAFDSRRRRGLAVSAALHLLVLSLFALSPDLLRSTPRRVIRIAGEDFDPERFLVQELFLPPELAPPAEPPPVAELPPPAIEPPPAAEAAPPPPPPAAVPDPPPPAPPPPVIGPDDVIAEGARPDAEPNATEEGRDAPDELVPAGEEETDPEQQTGLAAGEPGEDGAGETEGEGGEPASPAPEPPPAIAENANPGGLTLPGLRNRAENLIDDALEEERRRIGAGGRLGSSDRVDQPPNLSADATRILSDTRGYDFGPYMNQVINRVRRNWYALIPEAARLGARGRVVLTFTILGDGGVSDLQIQANSGTAALDNAAAGAIQLSNPFARLPPDFGGEHLTLQFTFLYNWDVR